VAEQLAQGNASTSLTFNMHCLTMLMMGELADAMPMAAAARERHDKLRAAKYREVVERGAFYGQPHSEPVEQGQTDTALSMGGRRFGTTARKVDGGYVVNGRSSSSRWPARRRTSPRRPFAWATSRGSSARSICRCRRTRRA
jgi:hypothetical protein